MFHNITTFGVSVPLKFEVICYLELRLTLTQAQNCLCKNTYGPEFLFSIILK